MSSWCRTFATRRGRPALSLLLVLSFCVLASSLATACGSSDPTVQNPPAIRIASIVIDGGSIAVERGTKTTLTVTILDTAGKKITVPVVWRSTVDSIGTFDANGVFASNDTGVTTVTASALGVTSGAITIHVLWNGPHDAAQFRFNPPLAITPGTNGGDSIRVQVLNRIGGPGTGTGALVMFAVTGGGGSISPKYAPITITGVVAAAWTLGPTAGKNTATATVVGPDSLPLTYVIGSPVTFTITSFAALSVVQGDAQTGSVLAPLPLTPTVKLVDSLGKPRPGIPINFAPTGNGRVAINTVSTNVDGIASPGIWTLGDLQGDEQLVASVESAKLILHATATGSTVRYSANAVATAQNATCALTSDQFAACLGQWPQIGTGDTAVNQSVPTLTKGGVKLTSLVGGAARFCGTGTDLSIYCWGSNPLIDTSTAVGHVAQALAGVPTRLPSNIAWLQVSVGGQHNCALANDKTAYCWGSDTDGQLGDNGTDPHPVPAPVTGGFKFNSLTGGANHECALTADGSAFCWGGNSSFQLGDGTSATRRTPTAVSGTTKFATIAAGQNWTCALDVPGAAYCWGAGTPNNTPATYAGAPKFSSLSVGAAHACALTNDGTAYCWGNNSSGQLGDSTTTNHTDPALVTTTIRFRTISAGVQQTCGISTEGFLVCWGRNQFGEIGVTTPLVQTTPRYIVLEVKP